MVEKRTVLETRAADMFAFSDAVTDAGLLMLMTRTQIASVYDLVKARVPAYVRVDMRSAKGNAHVLIAGDKVETFVINNRAKIM